MTSLPGEALPFVADLVRADDPRALYEAFARGLPTLFANHSIVASFAFERDGGAMSLWSNVPQPPRPPEWFARAAALHPGLAYAREHPGVPVVCIDDVLDDATFEAHPFYQEMVRPEGWRYGLALLVWDRERLAGVLAINRRADQGNFTAAERLLGRALQPLVAAAWERIARLRVADDVRRAEEALLSTLPVATLLWSPREGKVLFHNPAAREALARWRGEDALKRPRSVTARWMPAEIVRGAETLATVDCPRGGLRALIRPLGPDSHFAADVVVVVIEEIEGGTPSPVWLRVAGELTPAEQQVAALAARGLATEAIAQRLGKSPLTVKKQLESVFGKAGVRSRAELAALFAGLVRP